MLALRKNLAVRPDLNKREIVERSLRDIPSSDPMRLMTSPVKITAVDPREGVKRPWRASHGLLLQYPLKDQRSRTLVRSSRKNAESQV
jgi:hypothetical protein